MALPTTTSKLQEQLMGAISAHGSWKARLYTAIDTGKVTHDVATVSRDDACEFGKWLYGGAEASVKASANYAKVKEMHARFHRETARVLGLVKDGKIAEAKGEMAIKSDYIRLSAELTQTLSNWYKGR